MQSYAAITEAGTTGSVPVRGVASVPTMSSVAIIGAGMAGLAAARALTAVGVSIVIYEQSRALGGRVATRRIGDCIVDHGAQNIKPGDSALADVMLNALPTDDLIRIDAPVRLYTADGQIW